MIKLVANVIMVPLMALSTCLPVYAQSDFNLNSISVSNISGSGDNTNIQPPLALAPNDVYDFPVKPGTAEWNALANTEERVKVCQIPELLLRKMSTAGLMETVLNYPFYWDIMASNSNLQDGFYGMAAHFNGIRELLRRKDAGIKLLLKYRSIPPPKMEATDMEIGEYFFYCYTFEILFAQDAIRANLTEAQLKEMKKELLAKYEIRKELKESGGFGKEIMELNGLLPQRRSTKAFPTVVYTPKHSEVKALQMQDFDEMDWYQMKLCAKYWSIQHPYATQETSCSKLYNCHSYAWHDQTGLSQIWINGPYQQQYWLDGSYSLWLDSAAVSGMKLDYYSDNHSAIFVSGQNPVVAPALSMCRSKWGDGPRMLHNCKDTPLIYNPTGGIHAYTLSPPAGNEPK
ncbi:MAG: hypothetical protein COT18_07115 [Elusimicrobia bacterium CG08_land_8_20_14_0_20_59_10]|nr:MAG: hypothetical protein COT18_07115 [Elusimicrobia bacterium CG08_land_8_20_14_0_20_59_10]